MPPSQPIAKGTVVAGRYVVERQLGEGGMGSVLLVQHVHTDEQLALKVLHSTVIKDEVALERFRREARTPARIASDHVVRVTDADVAPELGGAPFLVMEYLRGEDLEHVVERVGAMTPHDVVLYMRQTARALDKAHSIGIVHRDLKPENLFLTTREDGTPCIKLLDFGIAKLTGTASQGLERASATTTGTIFGTPLYMSPEQAKGESAKISPRTDVWALGLIAHRLLTGKDFWTAETITHLIAQIAYEPIPPASTRGSTFGPAYDAWFAGCCAREIDDRYASAGEAVSKLGQALGIELAGQPSLPAVALRDLAGKTTDDPESIDRSMGRAKSPLKMTDGPITTDPTAAGGKKRVGLVAVVAAVGLALGVGGVLFVRSRGASTPPVVAAPGPTPTAVVAAAASSEVTVAPTADPSAEPSVTPTVASVAPTTSPASPGKPSTGKRGPPATKPPPPPPPTSKPKAGGTPDPLSGRL